MKNNIKKDNINWQQIKIDVALEAVKAFAPLRGKSTDWTSEYIAINAVKLAEYFVFYLQKSQEDGLVIKTYDSEK